MTQPIVRIAARGDGVTASGRHVAFGVPGDTLRADGALDLGPHHIAPPCRHYPICGGCQLQHVDDAAYADYLRDRLRTALEAHGLSTEIKEPYLSPPRSRRRAALRAIATAGGVMLGFNEGGSHRIVDLGECHVLRPELFELLAPTRVLLGELMGKKGVGEVHLTLADQGADVLLKGFKVDGLNARLALSEFAQANRLARLATDSGLGPEVAWEPEPVTVTIAGRAVGLPIGAFLQATADGEAVLIAAVREGIGETDRSADLFAGIGTFALGAGATYAAEAARDSIAALKAARPNLRAEHRDLYRRPLDSDDLKNFNAVILDPPRSGAADQVAQLAYSAVARIAYVSCNPATFARDAKTLVEGGYILAWAKPVGQFRWSTHVELASAFYRL